MKYSIRTWRQWRMLLISGAATAMLVAGVIRYEPGAQPMPTSLESQNTALLPDIQPETQGHLPPSQIARASTADLITATSATPNDAPSDTHNTALVTNVSLPNAPAAFDQTITPGPEKPWNSYPILDEAYDCIIEPFKVVRVGTALRAVLDSMEVERSDIVTKGQLLARLDSEAEQSKLAISRARAEMGANIRAREESVALAARKYERVEKLYANTAVSAELLDEIKTEARVAEANLLQAREAREVFELEAQEAVDLLERHNIRSPISGVVTERLKAPGEVVNEETILIVAQIDPLAVEVILPAALFGSIEPGMRAEVEPEISDVGVRVASVAIVDRVIDPASGTFAARLELPNSDHSIPSGLHCQARFVAPE